MRPPLAPIGWPSAIAPPWGFTRSSGDPELSADGERLRREGLVELEEVDVLDARPTFSSALRVAGDRADPHDAGLDSDRRVALDDSERLQAALLRHALRHHHDR